MSKNSSANTFRFTYYRRKPLMSLSFMGFVQLTFPSEYLFMKNVFFYF